MLMQLIRFAVLTAIVTVISCQNTTPQKRENRSGAISHKPLPQPYFPTPPLHQNTRTACYKTTPDICMIEIEILKATNRYRAQQNRTPLKLGEKISLASREWSKSQGERQRIGHAGFTSERYRTIQQEYGSHSGVSMSSENVAMNMVHSSDPAAIAQSFVNMWVKSPGHRRNILSSSSVIGIGVYSNGSSYYATQIFGQESDESTISEEEIDPSNLIRSY